MAVDAMQTYEIARKPEKYFERNPLLGLHPSEQDVIAYFGTSYALVTLLSVALPAPWREAFQYSVIGVEAACVGNNLMIGIGIGF